MLRPIWESPSDCGYSGPALTAILKKLRTSRVTRLKRMILIEPRLAQDFFARAQI